MNFMLLSRLDINEERKLKIASNKRDLIFFQKENSKGHKDRKTGKYFCHLSGISIPLKKDSIILSA